jgi:hypothetical protein
MGTKSDLLVVPFANYRMVVHEACNKKREPRPWSTNSKNKGLITFLPCCECGKTIQIQEKEIEMDLTYPSIEQDEAFVGAFEYLNEELFGNELPVPMLVLTRNPKIRAGHFAPDSWTLDDGSTEHEIALNANVYANGDWKYAMTVLIHEMLHLEQWVNKDHGRPGYHNKKFCKRLKLLGIQPVDPQTGEPITCGDKVADRLIEGGMAEEVLRDMPDEYVFPYLPKEIPGDDTQVVVIDKREDAEDKPKPKAKRGVKVKYSCAVCGNNAWGKGDMVIRCEGMGDRWHEPRVLVEAA